MKHVSNKQSGFTLVEIAIVLVIIGLLLGGVLKGQSMIDNAKVKGLANEFRSVPSMVYAYQDKFKALPGDDPAAVSHQANATQATAATAGNGLIDTGKWIGLAAPAATDETSLMWQQLRLSDLSTGVATSGTSTNAVGGVLGLTSNAARPTSPAGVGGIFYVCSSTINGKIAKLLDFALDDGDGTLGSLWASVQAAAPISVATANAAYVDTNIYSVCQAA